MFGGGIYFADNPENALEKSREYNPDAIIIATLDVGRLKTENVAHNDWNLGILNSLGFDTVQMTCCKTGVEICVYEPHRIHIISIVSFTKRNFKFQQISDNINIDMSVFEFIPSFKRSKYYKRGGGGKRCVGRHCFNGYGVCVNCGCRFH